jgi:flavin reductase (DIM6/NTAB) family NADH-FMN oxidoreductase RutF
VTVVTFESSDGRHGLTVNSFTSVSLDPPLVLVSVATTARSCEALKATPFTVNVLGAEQERIARSFAGGPSLDLDWREGRYAPRLSGTLAFLECTPWAAHEAGDHTLFVGEVVDFESREGDALGYFNSRFFTVPESRLGHEYLI